MRKKITENRQLGKEENRKQDKEEEKTNRIRKTRRSKEIVKDIMCKHKNKFRKKRKQIQEDKRKTRIDRRK